MKEVEGGVKMDWHAKLYSRNTTHTDLDNLGISVENLRKTKALNSNKLNRYSRYQIMKAILGKDEDDFIAKK